MTQKWIERQLKNVPLKVREAVAYAYEGSAYTPNAEDYGITEEQAEAIIIDRDINQCADCGWWLFSGDYCHDHNHDEIICTDCCED